MASKNKSNHQKGKLLSGMESASKQGFDYSVDFFVALGLFGIYVGKLLWDSSKSFYKKYLKHYVYKIDAFKLKIVKLFSKISRTIMFKFYMFARFFADAKNVVAGGYNSQAEASFIKKLFNAAKAFSKGVKNNTYVFVTMLNYALPVVAISLFVTLVSFVSSLNFAVAVEYNGEHVGYIANEAVFESAEVKLQERMIYLEGDEIIDNIPKFSVAIIEDQPLKTDAEMTDTIIQSSAGDIVKATGLSIDGEFYGAVKNASIIKTELNQMLDAHRTNTEGEEVTFAKDISTEAGLFLARNIVDESEVIAKVTAQEQKDVYYEIVKGDTPSRIAAKNDMSLDDLIMLNKDILNNCKIGKQVLVKRSQAFLPVKVTRTETYTKDIAFAIETVESNTLYKGRQQVTKAGIKGKEAVSAKVEYVDGNEVGRTIINTTTISAPVNQVVTKGTKPLPSGNIVSGKVSGYGFMWPVRGGYLSQGYGGRNNHNGIDYAYRGNGYGQPIYAALDGKVIYSGKRGSYGELVIIQSPGGVQTWYAHCSKRGVSVGQEVIQGQQIANVGNTGRSFGNHLHFRILINGVQKNPMNYLP